MRQATFAVWSRSDSVIHRLDARTKLVLLIGFILSLSLIARPAASQLSLSLAVLCAAVLLARLPLLRVLMYSFAATPFVGFFALIIYANGDGPRAWSILAKTYLCAMSVLVTVSVTPFSRLLTGAMYFHFPEMLLEVCQLIYRYLFLFASHVQQMQIAFASRGGVANRRAVGAYAGMVAILFSRSYERAITVHQAMLARGFSGTLLQGSFPPWPKMEILLAGSALLGLVALHFLR